MNEARSVSLRAAVHELNGMLNSITLAATTAQLECRGHQVMSGLMKTVLEQARGAGALLARVRS